MKTLKTISEERMDFVAQEAVKGVKEDIRKLYNHAEIANHSMSELNEKFGIMTKRVDSIESKMGPIETNISWLVKLAEKGDSRTWWIITTVILGALLPIAIQIYRSF